MKKWMRLIGALVLAVMAGDTHAQDLHFSQYFNAPLLVNPANTGFNPDYDFRIGANYRDQWANVGTPYRTMSAWGDVKLFTNRFENGWVGVGGALYKDMAGSGSLGTTKAYASVAYHQMLGYNSLLSGGFSVGYTNKRIDVTKLSFDDQWNGKFFDISIPTGEPFANSQVSYLDLQMGLNYAYFASENVYFNAGISVKHINNPRESFYDPTVSDSRVYRRYTAFVNSSIKLQDVWIFNPNLYVSKMGNVWETVIGFNANRDLSGDGSQQLILGLYYRHNDAVIPVAGYEVNDLRITLNYDATISTLGGLNGTRGAYELSIVKSGIFSSMGGGRSVRCPTVRF
jgi:type IX secretion system PorP/SprF family membrane protein